MQSVGLYPTRFAKQNVTILSTKKGMMSLKRVSICALLTLMITLFAGTALQAWASEKAGYFDEMDGSVIVGWGWDSSSPNTAVPVHITVTRKEDGETVGNYTPTAGVYREDLEADGIGNGRHGFQISMDWNTLPDGTYEIRGWSGDEEFANTQTYIKGEKEEETAESGESSADIQASSATPGMKSLGYFRTTGYCPCRQCSEGWGRRTSTGTIATSGRTIAVDPRIIPYGSKVMIGGVIYTAEDRGGGVRGKHIDIFYDSHSQSKAHGVKQQEVFLLY